LRRTSLQSRWRFFSDFSELLTFMTLVYRCGVAADGPSASLLPGCFQSGRL
jgi:hypothetical protein